MTCCLGCWLQYQLVSTCIELRYFDLTTNSPAVIFFHQLLWFYVVCTTLNRQYASNKVLSLLKGEFDSVVKLFIWKETDDWLFWSWTDLITYKIYRSLELNWCSVHSVSQGNGLMPLQVGVRITSESTNVVLHNSSSQEYAAKPYKVLTIEY